MKVRKYFRFSLNQAIFKFANILECYLFYFVFGMFF